MKTFKNTICFILLLFCGMLLCGCGDEKENQITVRYLNFKPEVSDVWEQVGDEYEKISGVKIEIINSPSNCNEQTLQSEIAKKNAPTLFQINGDNGYESWKNYCLDLSNTNLYSWVVDKDMVVKGEDGNGVYGIPYVIEGYGIIYNDAIMQKYFGLSNKKTPYKSVDEINNYAKLKEVVEDMTANKDVLGIEGVFASTSMATGEEWRWQSHLFNIPLVPEFEELDDNSPEEVQLKYFDNYFNIFDLYLDNSVCSRKEVGKKTVENSMEEFALGKCAMVQNGNWAWKQISDTEGNVVSEEDCKFLPIYSGIEGEENQGICIGTECYMCVNNMASAEEQKAAIDFLEWLFSSEIGKSYVKNDFQFITVFDQFSQEDCPDNPLAREVSMYLNDETKKSVPWKFSGIPNQEFKDAFSNYLYKYTQSELSKENVVSLSVEEWAKQAKKEGKEEQQ